jgi:tRNA dimethylallyltransferase
MVSTIVKKNSGNQNIVSGKKLLCIVGPTATGKTKLATMIAKQFPAVVISADSRQVYIGMDKVTGKDHSQYLKVWGIDIVKPDEESSVATWFDAITPAMKTGKLPIIVGGTGLYVKAMTDGIQTMKIPPNLPLRETLEKLSLSELQNNLKKSDKAKWENMNDSDRSNPRRLVRALEIAQYSVTNVKVDMSHDKSNALIVGLKFEDEQKYRHAVRRRVIQRLHEGAVQETEKLLDKYNAELPSMTAIGYKSLIRYVKGEVSEQELVDAWTGDELRYAKRQLTWFNKVPNVHWFDPTLKGSYSQVAHLVTSWYD